MVREKSEKYDAVIGQILNHAPQSELIGNLYIILRMYPLSCGQENQVDRSSALSCEGYNLKFEGFIIASLCPNFEESAPFI